MSFFLILNAAVPPIKVPMIVNGSGTEVGLEVEIEGANASPKALVLLLRVLTTPPGVNS